MSDHHCHARGCATVCRPEFLMCFAHWRRVPRSIQAAVYRHYRVGQCQDKRPSAEWFKAADAAIGFVARLEGHPLRRAEAEALAAFEAL